MGEGGGQKGYPNLSPLSVQPMFYDSRRFYNVLEGYGMFYHDFYFLKFLRGGVTPTCPHRVFNLFYDSRRFLKVL